MRNWLLPEHIEDILPPEARRVERLRTTLLELFRVHGYELVIPPLLEYLESLLTGTGHDLDLRTFKLVDQLSGRMMGLRADITPQVARIDAHLLNREGVSRLCYAGSVSHTRPRGINATREPLQIGAEIYGHAGIESDLEIRQLMLSSLRACGIRDARLDLGHVAVFRALCRRVGVGADLEAQLHEALEAKDTPRLDVLSSDLDSVTRKALRELPGLYGDASVLDRARSVLPRHPEILAALDDLALLSQDNGLPVSIDLADLRGYHYHSGVVLSAYAPGTANAVALGGRYDEVGKAFGRARPATGFSMDLRDLVQVAAPVRESQGIRAPYTQDPDLEAQIERLRSTGEVVVVELPGHEGSGTAGCDRELELVDGKWQLRRLVVERA
ncbi:MAG: ATP phosphoribosyltransferase regulatory subunit [Betaproteobacteria bacterium RIFCSPLOWO2_12_FULL_63_13]|nr:MAG: ATP phosphoribosyltransferase regulatory subunit [Betaproteobacteria bacterium RIFCSPLOWO2_02_FULL_63_19]OGA53351.1 MAG: ATP phosphoribosyltransferase regulatory subunit [Betaproteobacteria bacterium RIFCSPLOWO2_12_FULL_63_13]